jgi:EPS-associated MarR family transcriptional regulator|tara:strand:+ start:288 stop:590 length:303 start_codon:yes stop_codon:yes gene_type:complete
MNKNQEYLDILRKIKKEPENSQRNLSKNLGMSLGKLNYCLNSLKKKGIIKIKNFKNNPNKMKYAYIITPKGLSLKTKLTINFMKRKINEYDELKKELNSN